MISKQLLFVTLLGALLLEITGSPLSFPTERGELSKADEGLAVDEQGDDAEARLNHREKRKRKRMKLACLLALQQHSNRYKREAPGDGRTLLWGGLNYYDTNIHVYNGGYGGSRPSFSPGSTSQNSNPCQSFPLLTGFPSLPHLPSFPNFPNVGNEIINVISPGSSSSSSSSSGNPAPVNPAPVHPAPVNPAPVHPGGLGGGDGDNEDYDYSDGGSDSDNNRIKRRRKPAQTMNQSIDRYLDYYVFRPIDRTFRQLVRWF